MAYLDHSLLDVQPKTTCDATPENIGSIVVSAIINTAGNKVVISRYADDVWEMYPFFEQSNRSASEKRIDWLKQPAPFREQIKAILYRYWMVGREGFQRPTAGTVRDASVRVAVFLRYLLNLNVNRLVDISPTHVFNFIQYLQNTKNNQPKAINNSLQCIELL